MKKMKVKTFIILLIICIITPVIVINASKWYSKKKASKIDSYNGYSMRLKNGNKVLTYKNIQLNDIEKENEYIPLSIDVANNKNLPSKFKLLVFVDYLPVKIDYENKTMDSINFKMGNKENVTFDIKINGENFKHKNNRIIVMILKQEDINRYNDAASLWCNVVDESNKDVDASQMNGYYFQNINQRFQGLVLNNDFNINSNYNGYDYNKKDITMKLSRNNFKIALRTESLNKEESYLVFFTYGDSLVKVNNKENIILKSNENNPGFIILNIDINKKMNNKYLVCHKVKNPFNYNLSQQIITSNKILLK